jgi:hypothetical protein
MIKYICDHCNKETGLTTINEHTGQIAPSQWIQVDLNSFYHDKTYDVPGLIYAGRTTLHFCSAKCFVLRFVGNYEPIDLNNLMSESNQPE